MGITMRETDAVMVAELPPIGKTLIPESNKVIFIILN